MTQQNHDVIKQFVSETRGNSNPWKVKNVYGVKDYYRFYKKECKEKKIKYNLTN